MKITFLIALLFGGWFVASAAEEISTGFYVIKEGNKFINDKAKDKVILVHSEKSTGLESPKMWEVVYFDPIAKLHSTRVKFVDGDMTEVKRPVRLAVNMTPMDREKLKIDSDKALKNAMKQPVFTGLAIKATEFNLENDDNGPTWKITFWVAKKGDANKLIDIGNVQISAENGKILKNDLHLKKAL